MIYLLIWNVIVFLFYAVDKFLAKNDMWRISEKFLLTVTFLMGSAGAVLGMVICRHKTRKQKFVTLVPLAVVLNFAVIIKYLK